jgi:myosin heavy subunit
MNVMGMTADEQKNMFHLVAGILHLGNVAFYDGGKGTAAVHDENCTYTNTHGRRYLKLLS